MENISTTRATWQCSSISCRLNCSQEEKTEEEWAFCSACSSGVWLEEVSPIPEVKYFRDGRRAAVTDPDCGPYVGDIFSSGGKQWRVISRAVLPVGDRDQDVAWIDLEEASECSSCEHFERTWNQFWGYCPLEGREVRPWEFCSDQSPKFRWEEGEGYPPQKENPSPLPPLRWAKFPGGLVKA